MAASHFVKLFEEQECNICLNKHTTFLKHFCACNSRMCCLFCALTVSDTAQATDNLTENFHYTYMCPFCRRVKNERPTTHKLTHRRKRYDLIQLFKILHGYEDIEPDKFFEFNDNCTRGHLFKIVKPRCQKSLRMYVVSTSGIH